MYSSNEMVKSGAYEAERFRRDVALQADRILPSHGAGRAPPTERAVLGKRAIWVVRDGAKIAPSVPPRQPGALSKRSAAARIMRCALTFSLLA